MTESGQLQPEDTLDDRGTGDILDEGISPPEKLRGSTAKGVTPAEAAEGETLEERIRQEERDPTTQVEPEVEDSAEAADPADQFAGAERSGRLLESDEKDVIARDVGIDGGAASAEEAAVHVIDDNERTNQ
ncbi:MAG TPA: DUF5709 domain-containing protein [Aeromicrobium sp.]|nr:DUF5709 domain-containing protein [Aeromicrobium sp.]